LPKRYERSRGNATTRLACVGRLRTCAFVTCNQLGISSQSADESWRERVLCFAQVQSTNKVLRCKLTSSVTQGCALAAGFALMIDFQTLVTHNHTIICGSLGEGLTYSPCAQGAQADCRKKDCVYSRDVSEIMPTHSFTYLFTVSCQLEIGDFRDLYSLIYSKKSFCKSCDRFD
jgi:hypothetical protein